MLQATSPIDGIIRGLKKMEEKLRKYATEKGDEGAEALARAEAAGKEAIRANQIATNLSKLLGE